jgi:hypothetical protein
MPASTPDRARAGTLAHPVQSGRVSGRSGSSTQSGISSVVSPTASLYACTTMRSNRPSSKFSSSSCATKARRGTAVLGVVAHLLRLAHRLTGTTTPPARRIA